MLCLSTPLWREPTPIVHKINPTVPADPAQRAEHAVSPTASRAHAYVPSTATQRITIATLGKSELREHGDSKTLTRRPLSRLFSRSLLFVPCFLMFPRLLSFFFEKGKLYRPATGPNWL